MIPSRIRLLLLTLLLVFAVGCGSRIILVKPGTPVQLREEVKSVKVWAFDKDGLKVEGVVNLPAGWYCLGDPGE